MTLVTLYALSTVLACAAVYATRAAVRAEADEWGGR